MQFVSRLKKLKTLIILYGLVCAVEYYYFMSYQLPAANTAEGTENITYSTPLLTKIRGIFLDTALQELGLLGLALSAAVLTAFLYTIWLTGKYLFTKSRRRKNRRNS